MILLLVPVGLFLIGYLSYLEEKWGGINGRTD